VEEKMRTTYFEDAAALVDIARARAMSEIAKSAGSVATHQKHQT